jgi:O-antigen/teichoic acid export membrane protein
MFSEHFKKVKQSAAAVNVSSSVVRVVGRGVWGMAVPSVLSVQHYAIYSIWQTTVGLLAQLGLLGAPQLLMREPRHSLPILGLVLHSVALMTVGLGLAYLVIPPQAPAFYVAASAGAMLTGVALLITARAKGAQQFASVVVSEAVGAGLLILGIPVILLAGAYVDYWVAIAVEVAAAGPALFILTRGANRLTQAERGIREARRYLTPVYTVGFLVLLDALLWRRVEVYFLGASPDGLAAISAFSLATQLGTLLMVVPNAINEAWYPTYAAAYREDRATFEILWRARRRTFAMLYVAFVVVSLPACAVLMTVWFTQYEWALVPMLSIIGVRVACGFAGFYTAILYAVGRERWIYPPALAGAASAVVGNAALTLSHGMTGVIIAYAITHGLVALLTLVVWRVSRLRT